MLSTAMPRWSMRAPFTEGSLCLLMRAASSDGLHHLCRCREGVFLPRGDAASVAGEFLWLHPMRAQPAQQLGTHHLDQTLAPLLLTPLAQMAIAREPSGKVVRRGNQRIHSLPRRRDGAHHRRHPTPVRGGERLHRLQLLLYAVRAFAIALVDYKNVW